MNRRHNEIDDCYVRAIPPDEWNDNCTPAPGFRHVLSPLLAGLELKPDTPACLLCVGLSYLEEKRRSMTGVPEQIEAEYWAWRGQWAVFTLRVAASAGARGYILALDPVYREPVELKCLAIAQDIVRSVVAAQACDAAPEGLK